MSIDRAVRDTDPVTSPPPLDAGARELCAEIMATPQHTRRRRARWPLGVPLVATIAAVTIAVTWLLPGSVGPRPASAALDIHRQGGYYLITVKDLFADPKRYQAELRGRGLNVSLRLVPVTPGAVGRPFVWDPRFDGLSYAEIRLREDFITTTRCVQPAHCGIGLKIPVDYSGHATIYLGRQTRKGEHFQDPLELNAPGAPLHCVGYLKKTVDQVRALLRQHGVPNVEFSDGRHPGKLTPPGSWYVHDGVLTAPGQALLLVAPTLKRPNALGPVVIGDPWRGTC